MPDLCFNFRSWTVGLWWDGESIVICLGPVGLMWDRT